MLATRLSDPARVAGKDYIAPRPASALPATVHVYSCPGRESATLNMLPPRTRQVFE